MPGTLRDLFNQRAARLRDRAALTSPDWGTLTYGLFRNRVEGIALGLLGLPMESAWTSATGTAWDWAAEVAVTLCGMPWEPNGHVLPAEVLGGPRFNDEAGRGPFHALEHTLEGTTPFSGGLTQGQWLTRLRRWNERKGWDHDSRVTLPLPHLGDPGLRAALWCMLYAGGHAILSPAGLAPPPAPAHWDPSPFVDLWAHSS